MYYYHKRPQNQNNVFEGAIHGLPYSPWIPFDKLMEWAEEEGIFFKEFCSDRTHSPRETLESFVSWAIQAKVQFGEDEDGEVHIRLPQRE